jgi:hypothetical protein
MNFVVSGCGIFEGRGWSSQPESPYDSKSLVIATLNNSLDISASFKTQISALIEDGKFLRRISEDFEIVQVEYFESFPKDFIVTRSEWGAKNVSDDLDALSYPVIFVVVTETTHIENVTWSRGTANCEFEVLIC